MLAMLWTNIGLLIHPAKTLSEFQHYSSKKVLQYGIVVSVLSMLSYRMSLALIADVSIFMVLMKLLSYYVGIFLFFSVVFMGFFIFYKKINVTKFFGIYLITDFPLLFVWPFTVGTIAFPMFSPIIGSILFVLFFMTYLLKIFTFKTLLQVTWVQTVIILTIPSMLVFLWIATTVLSVLGQSPLFRMFSLV